VSVEFFCAAVVFLFCLSGLFLAVLGNRSIPFLSEIPGPKENHPLVSVIAAARNEERGIERAVRSFLVLEYPKTEVIVVNDRSEDGTGEILARLSKEFPSLKVVDVRELPEGWLGKNHALWKGAMESKGDFLLFTDADVVFHPSVLCHAMGMVMERRLDHLAGFPEVRLKGVWLRSFMSYFVLVFGSFTRPWKARDPKSRAAIGIGAFNLVRRSAYLSIGTHEAFRLRPDDDLRLGQLLKRNGGRSDCAFASGLVEVEWYHTLAELFRGLEKNSFVGFEYRLERAVVATLGMLVLNVAPFVAPFFWTGWPALLMAASAVILLAGTVYSGRFHRLGLWPGLFLPLAALLFTVILWNGILKTLWKGGITWRGTFHPLAELRKNLD
jgi:cellulose synthase/poly-beta-1,6-N-acetylglucosamine synthase-like glycosyltransferase